MINDYFNKCYKRALRSYRNGKAPHHCRIEHNKFNDELYLIANNDKCRLELSKEDKYFLTKIVNEANRKAKERV